MRPQDQRYGRSGYYLKSNKSNTKPIYRLRKVRLVNRVEIAVGKAINHVAESKQEQKDKDAFPEVEGLEHRRLANQEQDGNQNDGYFRDPKFHAPDAEHVEEITQGAV